MNKKQAEALWDEMREAFANLERLIVKAIEERAWEPLGYDSFAACWEDRMDGVRLATDVARSEVVYALIREGKDDESIVKTLKGQVGDQRVKVLRKAEKAGVPARLAPRKDVTTTVHEHQRRLPGARTKVTVCVSTDYLNEMKALSHRTRRTLDEEFDAALKMYLDGGK